MYDTTEQFCPDKSKRIDELHIHCHFQLKLEDLVTTQ